jgi:TM2 domain-containing membrane protein YozV
MFCKNCGNQMPDGAIACVKCGFMVGTGDKHCAGCGAPVVPGQAMCTTCGAMLAPPKPETPVKTVAPVGQKSKVIAALLAFFLGGWGIHNFYLGHVVKGVIQLVLTVLSAATMGITGAVCGIWAFVEFIMILLGKIKDFSGASLK